LNQISSQMSSSLSRVRREDVDKAKHDAARLAKDRDEFNNHPRREEITKEIRVQEDRLKSISTSIEQDNKIRDQLRLRADEQNEIDMLERQVTQEYDTMIDLLKENSFLISSQGEGEPRVTKEDPLTPVDVLHNNVRNKLMDAQAEVERCNSAVGDVQKKVSEKQALLGNHRHRFQQLQQKKTHLLRDGGGVQRVKSVVKAIIRFDKDDIDPERINEDTSPAELLKYVAEQVKNYSNVEEKPENITKIVKRLKKMAKADLACPCCLRSFVTDDEITQFQARMTELADPDVSELHAMASKKAQDIRVALDKYESWRKTISENMGDYLELSRVVEEAKEVEALINDEEGEGYGSLKDLESDLDKEEATLTEKKELLKELQTLMTAVNGIQDTAKRVWEKMGNVKEKKQTLQYQFGYGNVDDPRDLKTVEKDLAKSSDKKEVAYTNINKLNNEQKQFNEKISRITNQAATAERSAREREDAFKRDQESTKRKDELNNELKKLTELEKDLEKQIQPFKTQLMQKESDRNRMRDANAQEDGMLGNQLKYFERDIDKLNDVNEKIDLYVQSSKEKEYNEVDQKLCLNAEDICSGEEKLNEMKPEMENLKKQVEDGERQKKIIQDNLELFKLENKLNKLQEEIKNLQDELDAMGGNDAREKHQLAVSNIRQHQSKVERYNGRMQGLTEQKRSLRRKLNEPEYKGVDERQRKKMIEHETTGIVVTDLDKYYDALDKALLRYHGMKINDINKIIRELWTLTYKGEDITNIEIQSGQDSGSRANRSYNYRIVMSKGNTQMDMRGRCSAGQRVLASIVIRLALAETFCLNCGVIALDEPTTNLDFENKRGLGIALGQIIASRAAQSNFQLVVITHDEEFVSMMKQELSSQTGFNMPERYYQVSREEGHDGRFYSRINAVDWDDL